MAESTRSVIGCVAERLLSAAVRRAPPHAALWAKGMLGELAYIDDDWDALRWALGSVAALVRCTAARRLAASAACLTFDHVRRTTFWLLSGTISATILMALCLLVLANLPHMSWRHLVFASELDRVMVVAGLEAICLALAVGFRHQHRSAAAGALVAGMVLFLHVVTYG